MNANEFKRIIKQLVKEEVQREVADQVNKSMVRLLGEVLNNRTVIPPPQTQQITEVKKEPVQVKQTVKKKYVNNPMLNDILNQTAEAGGLPSNGPSVSLDEPLQSSINSQPVYDNNTKIGMLRNMMAQSPAPTSTPSITEIPGAVPESLKEVFNRDFRAIMKAVDQKKKQGVMSGLVSMG
jgi:hypothetical protein